MENTDAGDVLRIYEQGLATRNATFETSVPGWQTWDANHHSFCRLVYEHDGKVVAWLALSPTSGRQCYRGVAEVSVYVADGFLGRNIPGVSVISAPSLPYR